MSSAPLESDPKPGRPSRWRFLTRSFRVQVTAWNTLTIFLFTIAILIGLRYGLSYTLQLEEDKLLAEDVTEVTLHIRQFAPQWDQVREELERKEESHSPRKWFGVIRDREGNILASTKNAHLALIPFRGVITSNPRTVESYRLSERRYLLKDGQAVQIVVGASIEGIEEDVSRLTQLIVVASLLLLILAPFGGFWLAGRVIRPLSDMTARTANLRPSDITERLPIRQTGDELDQLAMTINGLLDRIGNYLARHRDLTANAAHELRSPLAAMLSSAEVALHQERTSEEYRELLASIVEECSRLGSLVNQLLLLAESDAGRLERGQEKVRLDLLALKAVEMFHGYAESKGVSLEAHAATAVSVQGDPGHIRQVILNLIDNAIKFTHGGFVHVEVKTDADGNGILIVTDSGVGIPLENLPKVFDRFYRGDSKTRQTTGGSGLGLSICKALVTANGGTIEINSQPGRGTEVRISFPRAG
ncbi:MAG: HAMP domain-containing protein [Planctomycetes bacterium]|nr:HAMP domain-containing protein [Planctomycetota bacterium]